jgi:hypothetical protein
MRRAKLPRVIDERLIRLNIEAEHTATLAPISQRPCHEHAGMSQTARGSGFYVGSTQTFNSRSKPACY